MCQEEVLGGPAGWSWWQGPAASSYHGTRREKHQADTSWAAIAAQKARALSFPNGVSSETLCER